jgi:segregation and condensation protein A
MTTDSLSATSPTHSPSAVPTLSASGAGINFRKYQNSYSISLPNFEGPLDLLLFFIKRDELDIYDIPIATITMEFLDYIRLMELLDLELAGEFLVMASSLVQIKARMLLPKEEKENGEPDEDDPRNELIQRLLEYRRYKEMSEKFSTLYEEQRYAYYRKFFDADIKAEETGEEMLKNVTLFDLLSAFKKAIEKAKKEPRAHQILRISVTIEEQVEFILTAVRSRPQVYFAELFDDGERIVLVVSFLALLELIRSRAVGVRQDEIFGDILIYQQ